MYLLNPTYILWIWRTIIFRWIIKYECVNKQDDIDSRYNFLIREQENDVLLTKKQIGTIESAQKNLESKSLSLGYTHGNNIW